MRSQSKLYVAQDNADQIAVIDTSTVSTRYSQVNVLRTIEDILGTEHINLNTAFQRPMADVFDIQSAGRWTYTAEASTVLATTTWRRPRKRQRREVRRRADRALPHDAAYWDAVTAGFNFSEADQVPPALFNRVLWTGLMSRKPYPEVHGQAAGTRTRSRWSHSES